MVSSQPAYKVTYPVHAPGAGRAESQMPGAWPLPAPGAALVTASNCREGASGSTPRLSEALKSLEKPLKAFKSLQLMAVAQVGGDRGPSTWSLKLGLRGSESDWASQFRLRSQGGRAWERHEIALWPGATTRFRLI